MQRTHSLSLLSSPAAEDYDEVRAYSVKLGTASRYLGMPKGSNWAFYGPQNDTMGFHE